MTDDRKPMPHISLADWMTFRVYDDREYLEKRIRK